MAVPDHIDLAHNRDLEGRRGEIWVRRVLVLLFAAVPLLALLNIFGQRASESSVSSSVATLKLHAPSTVRGGLLFEARFTVQAHQEIKNAVLLLGAGWADGLTINTIEPSPSNEASENNKLSFQLGDIPAGQEYVLHMQFQVNPTTVGSLPQSVEVFDGSHQLAELNHTLAVYP